MAVFFFVSLLFFFCVCRTLRVDADRKSEKVREPQDGNGRAVTIRAGADRTGRHTHSLSRAFSLFKSQVYLFCTCRCPEPGLANGCVPSLAWQIVVFHRVET